MVAPAGAGSLQCRESRSHQEAQASTPTAHTGSQCSLGLLSSVGCQTEEDHCSDTEVDFVQPGSAGWTRFPALACGAEGTAEASQPLQWEPSKGSVHGLNRTRNCQHAQVRNVCISSSSEQSRRRRTIVVTFPQPVQDRVPQFTCSICQQAFCERSSLYVHMKQHGDEKPFLCSACQKAFTKKYCLVVHQRLHTGEKPYACKFCPESFARRDRFLIHERLHTGEQPFVCGVCKKSFAEKRNLVFHERLHSGERPYVL